MCHTEGRGGNPVPGLWVGMEHLPDTPRPSTITFTREDIEMNPLKKLVHSDDAITAHQAIHLFALSGKRKTHNEIVLEAVQRFPGCTAITLMKHTGLTEYQVRRRLTDLKNQKLINSGQIKLDPDRQTDMVTWWPAEEDGQMRLC